MRKVLVAFLATACLWQAGVARGEITLLDLCPGVRQDRRLAPRIYQPQAGDMIIFVSGNWATRAVFSAFTDSPVSHVSAVVEINSRFWTLSAEKELGGVILEEVEAHLQRCQPNDVVWVRQLKTPLKDEQKERLAVWALKQNGKPYAPFGQLAATPYRVPVIREVWGSVAGSATGSANWRIRRESANQPSWFCSQLAFTAFQVCGVANPDYRASAMDPGKIAYLCGPWTRPFCLVRITPP